MRDPLYKKILESLEGPLDRDLFEEGVVDLLRDAFPTLVPIHGGHDAGMDGAIADGEGEPYPLIVTTDQSPIRNLTKSLDSYRAKKGKLARSRIVFATSRVLTPTQRRNLEARAQEKGFTLVQIFERRGLANRLYRDPGWRKALLGLPGDPPALSAVPRTRRPLFELEPVGREADLEWLRTTHGDRLLYGEPGSGKTFLLLQLVREGRALFLASEDWAEIADAMREHQPKIVIVDDAHLDPGQLDRLRQVQEEIRAEFDILATCWLGEKDQVAEALQATPKNMHRLELLTRKEILEVLRQAGVRAENEYMGDLINQSANKPGLAVTLAEFWLRGEWKEVFTGQALRISVIESLKRVLGGQDPAQLLATFSVGGDAGLPLDLVAEALNLSRLEVWERAVKIAAGGVLAERGGKALAVEPAVLRHALLNEVFSSPAFVPFDYRDLLDKAPSTASGVETLVLAAQRGVEVPREELLEWVRHAGTQVSWEVLASFDQDAAFWVLEQYPEPVEGVARATLHHAPKATISLLLKRAEAAKAPRYGQPQPPLPLLKQWIQEIPTSGGEMVAETLCRRQSLVQEVQHYLESGGVPVVAQEAFLVAFSPLLEGTELTPTRDAVTLRSGTLPESALSSLMELWRRHQQQMPLLCADGWPHLVPTLQWWLGPRVEDEKLAEAMRSFGRQMLEDLVPRAEGSPGLTSGLSRLADRFEVELPLELDEVFEVLFPRHCLDRERLQAEEDRQELEARSLAEKWSMRAPKAVAGDLGFYLAEGSKIELRDPYLARVVCRELAKRVRHPKRWLGVFQDHDLPAELTCPFLDKAVESRLSGWEHELRRFLQIENYSRSTAALVLRLAEPPQALLDASLEVLKGAVELVETACLGGAVPVPTLKRLLVHPDWRLALAAASGEWNAEPLGQVRVEVQGEWRVAILKAKSEECGEQVSERVWLSEILGHDSALALEWLQRHLQDSALPNSVDDRGAFVSALGALSENQKRDLLVSLQAVAETRSYFVGQLIKHLAKSLDTYSEILRSKRLRRFHLTPLEGAPPGKTWGHFARLAVEAGFSPEDVAEKAFESTGAIVGFGVEHWAKWETAFAEMAKTADGPLLEVARHGLEIARKRIEEAKKEQRQYELTGHF